MYERDSAVEKMVKTSFVLSGDISISRIQLIFESCPWKIIKIVFVVGCKLKTRITIDVDLAVVMEPDCIHI